MSESDLVLTDNLICWQLLNLTFDNVQWYGGIWRILGEDRSGGRNWWHFGVRWQATSLSSDRYAPSFLLHIIALLREQLRVLYCSSNISLPRYSHKSSSISLISYYSNRSIWNVPFNSGHFFVERNFYFLSRIRLEYVCAIRTPGILVSRKDRRNVEWKLSSSSAKINLSRNSRLYFYFMFDLFLFLIMATNFQPRIIFLLKLFNGK